MHRDEDRNVYAFHGVHHEVTRPERIISTFEFEGLPEPGHLSLETTTFKELPGGKAWVMTKLYSNQLRIVMACSGVAWKKELMIHIIGSMNF